MSSEIAEDNDLKFSGFSNIINTQRVLKYEQLPATVNTTFILVYSYTIIPKRIVFINDANNAHSKLEQFILVII